jgi:hypothetical protein
MRTLRKYTGAVVAMTLLCLVAVQARAQVLQQMPADAFVVIKIKNLQDVSGKVAMLSQQWGLANMRPELNDPLGSVLGLTGLGQGLNKNGEAGVAIMAPQPNEREPRAVVLVPVSDYKAFTASLPNAAAEGEFQTFRPGEGGPMVYASNWGAYAALSNQKDLISKKGAGMKVSPALAKELDSKDLVAYVNLKPVKQQALDGIRQNKPMILNQIERGMAQAQGADPKFAPVMKAYIGQFFAVAETFLTDAEGVSFGINLGKDGISTSFVAEFAPGSYVGKNLATIKNTNASFTAGLPEGKYFVYGGMGGDGGDQFIIDFLKPIEAEIAKLGEEGKAFTDYINAMKDYMAAIKHANFGLIAPPAAAIGQQGLIQMAGVIHGDVQKIEKALTQMMGTQEEFMKMMGPAGDIMSMTHTPKAKTVEGVELDAVTVKVKGQPKTPQEQQMVFMMNMLYGPGGTTTMAGNVDQDTMVMTTGVTDAVLTKAVQAAKGNTDTLKNGPAGKVAAALPQNKIIAFYVPVDNIATTVLDFMAARGMPGGVKIPPNLPPLGGAIAVEGPAFRIDGYVPSQTVQSMIAAGMQLYLQQMPGGQPKPGEL